jgi:hypothetical protein
MSKSILEKQRADKYIFFSNDVRVEENKKGHIYIVPTKYFKDKYLNEMKYTHNDKERVVVRLSIDTLKQYDDVEYFEIENIFDIPKTEYQKQQIINNETVIDEYLYESRKRYRKIDNKDVLPLADRIEIKLEGGSLHHRWITHIGGTIEVYTKDQKRKSIILDTKKTIFQGKDKKDIVVRDWDSFYELISDLLSDEELEHIQIVHENNESLQRLYNALGVVDDDEVFIYNSLNTTLEKLNHIINDVKSKRGYVNRSVFFIAIHPDTLSLYGAYRVFIHSEGNDRFYVRINEINNDYISMKIDTTKYYYFD